MSQSLLFVFFIFIILCDFSLQRKHHLIVSNDQRKLFPISTFGYFTGGSLNVTVASLSFKLSNIDAVSNQTGFTLIETTNSNYSPYLEGEKMCLLDNSVESYNKNVGIVQMRFDFKNLRVQLDCNDKMSKLYLHSSKARIKRQAAKVDDNEISAKLITEKIEKTLPEKKTNKCYQDSFEMIPVKIPDSEDIFYSFQWQMIVSNQAEGLYQLYFHNCLNYPFKHDANHGFNLIDFDLYLEEKNIDNYLSAGEMPLPQLYFVLSIVFILLGIIWFYSLQSKQSETFRIHYLMGVLVFVKAFSLFFHGVNYYFIAKEGTQVETWAILYYVTHFLKGALLFFTVVLIGSGWAFVKHILSDKDKKIFMIVIPLQIIANIADIIIEESEEGALIHMFGKEIFIIVDLICCGAILFPVIWSIHHLQEASQTDGKAALNLKKLQLFRQFYVMIVVYIYFTRIIVYLVKITVPFNYQWLEQLFQHSATFIFFLFTGYRFQPTGNNPYYQLLHEEFEMDEEVLFIQPNTFSEAKKRHRDLESSSDKQTLLNASYEFD